MNHVKHYTLLAKEQKTSISSKEAIQCLMVIVDDSSEHLF
jgi:hypothetical protein